MIRCAAILLTLLLAPVAIADEPDKVGGNHHKRRVFSLTAQNNWEEATHPGLIHEGRQWHQGWRNNTGHTWRADFIVCTFGSPVTTMGLGDTYFFTNAKLSHAETPLIATENCNMAELRPVPVEANTTYTEAIDCDVAEAAGCSCFVEHGDHLLMNGRIYGSDEGDPYDGETDRFPCAIHYTILD